MDGCSQLRLLHKAPNPLSDFRDAVESPLGPPEILLESSQSFPQVLSVLPGFSQSPPQVLPGASRN